jgi:hypothetical protein
MTPNDDPTIANKTLNRTLDVIPRWKQASNKAIAENLLTSIAELLDGRWYTTETLDYTGKRTRRYIIESDITEGPDSPESNVSGSDSSDT